MQPPTTSPGSGRATNADPHRRQPRRHDSGISPAPYASHGNPQNLSSVVDATDPNLTAFYKAGGKLIQWQGWADQFIPPYGSVAYRQAVINTMGAQTAAKFYRLYMFPRRLPLRRRLRAERVRPADPADQLG